MIVPKRLRTRVVLVAMGAIAPAVALIAFSQIGEREAARSQALREAVRIADSTAALQAGVLDGASRLLMTLSHLPDLPDPAGSTCGSVLAQVLADHPGLIQVSVVHPDGSVVCNGRTPDRPLRPLERTWFKRAMATKKLAVGDFQISPTNGRPDIVLAHPVLDKQGAVAFVLIAAVRVDQLEQVAERIQIPPRAALTVFDRNQTVLFRFPAMDGLVGRTLPDDVRRARLVGVSTNTMSEAVGIDGVRRFEMTVPVRAEAPSELYVTFGIERGAAFADADRALVQHLLLLAFVAAASLLLAYTSAHAFVVKPLRTLSDAIGRIAAGDFQSRVDVADGGGTAELASAINGMADALERGERQRDAAEAELRASEDQYRLLFDDNPHPMWVYDVETLQFLAVNQAAIDRYGYARDEFLTSTIRLLHSPDDSPAIEARPAAGLATYRGTWKHRTKQGRVLDVDVCGNVMTWRGKSARLVLADDITARMSLEGQLRQSQRMDAIGQLAGGIAHDFNNLLTAILGYAGVLEDNAADPTTRDAVEQISRAGRRAADLTRQLLAFSRRQRLEPRVLQLSSIVGELAPMLRRLIGESIAFKTIAEERGAVKADPGQLQQILMNLVINARDAMPLGGQLTIETSDAAIDASAAAGHALMPPGHYVLLSVSDSGCGIDPAIQARIFEPFFTTKPQGQGTGLGLSTVYGIVKQSGGFVWVYSEIGRGTTFKIYLPRTNEQVKGDARPEAPARVASGTETILLVEDEELLRSLAARILEARGYRVNAMSDPLEALHFVRTNEAPVDLLLTDVVLPNMNGCALADEVRSMRPDTRVLYMSGYASEAVIHQGMLKAGTPFLAKPFTAHALADKVRETLDACTAGTRP
jgi:two-component system cell cycle sensor histidine kinase/response regulator CckA